MSLLFATPGMTTISVIVLLLEMLSLIFLGVCILEFRVLTQRHAAFFRDMGNGQHEEVERRPRIFLWMYIITTIVMTIATTYLFLFQPHIF